MTGLRWRGWVSSKIGVDVCAFTLQSLSTIVLFSSLKLRDLTCPTLQQPITVESGLCGLCWARF